MLTMAEMISLFLQSGGVWVRHVENHAILTPSRRLGDKCTEELKEPSTEPSPRRKPCAPKNSRRQTFKMISRCQFAPRFLSMAEDLKAFPLLGKWQKSFSKTNWWQVSIHQSQDHLDGKVPGVFLPESSSDRFFKNDLPIVFRHLNWP